MLTNISSFDDDSKPEHNKQDVQNSQSSQKNQTIQRNFANKRNQAKHLSINTSVAGTKRKRAAYKRIPLGERLRKVVAANQRWNCGNCNEILQACFEVDHIIPVCNGGTNDQRN